MKIQSILSLYEASGEVGPYITKTKPTAVIVKGNPKYLKKMSKESESFYDDLKAKLEAKGYDVSFDDGLPYTQPQSADLWVGHSRGVDRLRFAPSHTKTIEISTKSNDPFSVNHYILSSKDLDELRKLKPTPSSSDVY